LDIIKDFSAHIEKLKFKGLLGQLIFATASALVNAPQANFAFRKLATMEMLTIGRPDVAVATLPPGIL